MKICHIFNCIAHHFQESLKKFRWRTNNDNFKKSNNLYGGFGLSNDHRVLYFS